MTIFIIVIIAIAVIYFVFIKPHKSNVSQSSVLFKKNPGMYFMECYEVAENLRKSSDDVDTLYYVCLSDWNFLLGCACQGRIGELDDNYDYYKGSDCKFPKPYIELLLSEKERIYRMAHIAKRIDDAPIGKDHKIGESIGEYTDRKLCKSQKFMTDFTYYLNFDFDKYVRTQIA